MNKAYFLYIIAGLFSWIWFLLIVLTIYTIASAIFWEGTWQNVLLSVVGVTAAYKTSKFLQKKSAELYKNHFLKIIHAYGDFIGETNIPSGVISDEAILPYSKNEIKDAIKHILKVTRDNDEINVLKIGYFDLAYFQPNIGDKPIGILVPEVGNIDEIMMHMANQKEIPTELKEQIDRELLESKQQMSVF